MRHWTGATPVSLNLRFTLILLRWVENTIKSDGSLMSQVSILSASLEPSISKVPDGNPPVKRTYVVRPFSSRHFMASG
jgi:hypothetical protein